MTTDNHSENAELVRLLTQRRDVERGKAEHHHHLAAQMDKLITLLKAGGSPSADLFSQLQSHDGTDSTSNGTGHGRQISAPREHVPAGRKFRRKPEFENLSTIAAVRQILAENGPQHANDLAVKIFHTKEIGKDEFRRIKSTIVSEVVKAVKRGEMRRTGENIFALSEG